MADFLNSFPTSLMLFMILVGLGILVIAAIELNAERTYGGVHLFGGLLGLLMVIVALPLRAIKSDYPTPVRFIHNAPLAERVMVKKYMHVYHTKTISIKQFDAIRDDYSSIEYQNKTKDWKTVNVNDVTPKISG